MDEGSDLLELIRELYPLTRSITGDGVRKTLQRLTDIVPMAHPGPVAAAPALRSGKARMDSLQNQLLL